MIETILTGKTPDIGEENIKKLMTMFPEVVTEGKVDFEKLRQVLGEYVDDSNERYNFTWNGKGRALRLSQTPSLGTLRPCKEESKNWDTTQNLYIEGDNLEVLKLLQKSYYGKIKMIYIDPPYNTGKDFVYKDDFHDSIENYKRITGQVDGNGNPISTNPETSGRYHTDWLNMMYPRLRLARNLLRDDGVIFISIDDNEVHNLRKICDEVFGEENFITKLIWQKKTGASDSSTISTITEYIVVYSKNMDMAKFSRNAESYDLKRYKYQDEFLEERGPYYIDNLDRGGLQYSDSLNYGIECPDGTITYPNGRTEFVNDGWIWKWSKQKVDWARQNKFLEFRKSDSKQSGWAVYYKNYLKVDNENKPIERAAPYKNLITDVMNANAANVMREIRFISIT
jgi:adenine-specific DNA-methyltransferase